MIDWNFADSKYMARRMFSPVIVCSDAFLDMPTSSRELYFQLGMAADDDGFVNPRKTMRMVGASDDDLKILIGKHFVLPFEGGVIVIKHWRINNAIRKDIYKTTVYTEQKKQLMIKKNMAYTLDETQGKPLLQLRRRHVDVGKDRIGEGSVGKERSGGFVYPEDFLKFWDGCPLKIGKGAAWASWKRMRPPVPEVFVALEKQARSLQWRREGGRFVPHPATWLNQRRWEDEVPEEKTQEGKFINFNEK